MTLTFTLVGTCDGFIVSGDNLVGSDTGGVVPMATTAGNKACSVTASDGTSMPTIAFTVPVTDIPPVLTAVNDTESGTEDEAMITGNVIDGSSGGRDTSPTATPTVVRYAAGSSLAGAVNAPASAPGTHGRLTIATTGAFTYTVAASNNALTTGSQQHGHVHLRDHGRDRLKGDGHADHHHHRRQRRAGGAVSAPAHQDSVRGHDV